MKDEDYALYQAMAQVTEQDKSRTMTREFLINLLQSGGGSSPLPQIHLEIIQWCLMHLDRHVEPAGSWVVAFDAWVRGADGYLSQWNLYGSKSGCHLQITHDYSVRPYSEEEYAAFSKTQYEIAKRHNSIPNTHHESVVTIYDVDKGQPITTTYELMMWLSKGEPDGHSTQTLRSGDEVKHEELPRTDEGTGGV